MTNQHANDDKVGSMRKFSCCQLLPLWVAPGLVFMATYGATGVDSVGFITTLFSGRQFHLYQNSPGRFMAGVGSTSVQQTLTYVGPKSVGCYLLNDVGCIFKTAAFEINIFVLNYVMPTITLTLNGECHRCFAFAEKNCMYVYMQFTWDDVSHSPCYIAIVLGQCVGGWNVEFFAITCRYGLLF